MRLLVGILVERRRGRDMCSGLLDPPLAFLPPGPLFCTALRNGLRNGVRNGLCKITFGMGAGTFRTFREVLVKSLLQV